MNNMTNKAKGTLIIIGGHEDKEGDQVILKELVNLTSRRKGPLVVATVASQLPKEMIRQYKEVFGKLGIDEIEHLNIREREDAKHEDCVELVKQARAIFFTGGDQLRITSQIGDSPVYQEMVKFYENGGVIAGTSAGAAAMCETMLIDGEGDKSAEISALNMAPGLGFIHSVVIDSHFAERGRIGRLIGAVAQNPRNLGLGIDEDTAVIVKGDEFRVMGSGAVYVLDGTTVTSSSLSEKHPSGVLSINNLSLHVLGSEDKFDLAHCKPIQDPEKDVDEIEQAKKQKNSEAKTA